MRELKIGDRVMVKHTVGRLGLVNQIGTVLDINDYAIAVQFDNRIRGHSCNGRGKLGHCWNCMTEFGMVIPLIQKQEKAEI